MLGGRSESERLEMANREQRKNKEKKKPKADKSKLKPATTSTSPFADPRTQKQATPGKK
jgi:hypothetical protein